MEDKLSNLMARFAESRPLLEALGDPTRQEIVYRLYADSSLTVGGLALEIGLSRPAVSHHIKILKSVGVLEELRSGTKRHYRPVMRDAAGSFQSVVEVIRDLSE